MHPIPPGEDKCNIQALWQIMKLKAIVIVNYPETEI